MKALPLDLPPIWALGAAALAWLLGRTAPVLTFDRPLLAALVFAAGVALMVWAAVWFARKKTPIEPRHRPEALITEGPYRINRNPIYTGLVLAALGIALGQGALSALLPVLPLPWILTRRFILAEEAALRAEFGQAAEDWLAATRRW